jgi:hypothetical protein
MRYLLILIALSVFACVSEPIDAGVSNTEVIQVPARSAAKRIARAYCTYLYSEESYIETCTNNEYHALCGDTCTSTGTWVDGKLVNKETCTSNTCLGNYAGEETELDACAQALNAAPKCPDESVKDYPESCYEVIDSANFR